MAEIRIEWCENFIRHQLVHDAVQRLGCVACLSVTLSLLAGFTVTDIAYPLNNAVWVILAWISLAVRGKGEAGTAVTAEHISSQ